MKTRFFALATLALALVACNNDNENLNGDPVAARFTADIAPVTRASGTTWTGGDRIGITDIGNDSQYGNVPFILKNGKFEAEGKVIYIEDTKTHTFRAYYPYNAAGGILTATTDATAQQNQPAIDFLFASGATGDKNNPVVSFTDKTAKGGEDNSFHHRMSQITLTFEAGDGVNFSVVKPERYTLDGLLLTGTFNTADGIATADNGLQTGELTMNLADGNLTSSIILFPQTVASLPLVVNYKGQEYHATLTMPDGALLAGNNYTYTVKVNATGLTLDGCTIGYWTDGGSEDVRITISYDGSETEAKIGDYYYADGTWSDGGLRKLYADGKMEWAETTPQPMNDKTCIGIVFYTGRHETDRSDYTKPLSEDGPTIPNGKVNGYVVALTDVHDGSSDRLRWEYGPGNVYNKAIDASTSKRDWQGYSNSLKFHEFVNKNENKAAGWEMKHFPAALACETYGNRMLDEDGNDANGKYDWQKPLAAPGNTSGWFLPSCGQLQYLYKNRSVLSARMTDVKNSTPTDCSYKDEIEWFSTGMYYWSSTEYSRYPYGAWDVDFSSGGGLSYYKDRTGDVRAVLAF